MSSKRKSYDTDEITLRKVFARSDVNNAAIAGMRVLTADGVGGTYWAIPSTLGYNPSFNQINTSVKNFTADASYNIFTLTEASGIGFSEGSGSNQLYIYGKSFTTIDVSGNNSILGFTDNIVTPSVKLAGEGGLTIRSNPQTNTIFFDMPGIQVSSSLYSFQKVQVYSNASTFTDNPTYLSNIILNAASPSTTLGLIGLNDIRLFTNATSNLVYIDLKQSTGSVSTLTGLYSNLSSVILNTVVTSTVRGLGTAGYISSLSTFNLSTQNLFTSTVSFMDINNNQRQVLAVSSGILVLNGLGIQGGSGTGDVTSNNIVSTVVGLGTAGYVSTPSLVSSIAGLGGLGYVSTPSLVSTLAGLGVAGYVSSTQLTSTIAGLSNVLVTKIIAGTNVTISPTSGLGEVTINASGGGGGGGITDAQLVSTVVNLGTAGYLSTSQIVSTVAGLGTAGYLSSIQLLSTVAGLGAAGYVSSTQLGSTVAGLYTSLPTVSSLVSTTEGLGTIGYISTPQLVSTVAGLGAAGYVSSTQLGSTVAGLYTSLPTVSSLVSTTEGLGTIGYISTPQLVSTVAGLGAAGYLSSIQLFSTVAGLGAAGYISTPSMASTVAGLGTAGYVSSFSSMIVSSALFVGGAVEISTVLFKDAANTNKYNLISSNAALYFNGSVVGSGSVINNFNTSTYIYQVSSVSTLFTNADFTTISSATNVFLSPRFISTQFLSAGTVQTSSIQFIDTTTAAGQLLAVNNGVLQLNLVPLVTTPNLASTVANLGTAGYISTANMQNLVSTPNLLGLVSTQNLLGHVSTQNLLGLVSSANLLNLVSTLNLQGLVSSANLLNLVSTQNLQGLVSSQNLLEIVSTSYLASQLTSTVVGLGTSRYVSTPSLVSSVEGLGTAGYISSASLSGLVSTQNLLGLVSTQNLTGIVSTANLLSLIGALNQQGLVSSPNLLNLVSSQNLQGLVSSPNLLNLVSSQNLLGLVSSASLQGLVSSQNLLGLVSTNNLLSLIGALNQQGLVSTQNLLGLVSTSFFDSKVTSTIVGLSNVAVTRILQGTNVTISPGSGLGEVTINASATGDVTTANLVSTVVSLSEVGYVSTSQMVSTNQNLGHLGYISSQSLVSSTQNWSFYPAVNNIVLSTTTLPSKIINNGADFGQPLEIQSGYVDFIDKFNAPASVTANLFQLKVSTTSELYGLVNGPLLTGTISSMGIYRSDGISLTSGSFYISSLYFGNFGGTTTGQLTTDATATDLFWKGSKLNDQGGGGGGGITTAQLVSTVANLGFAGYVSTSQLVSTSLGLQNNYVGQSSFISSLSTIQTTARVFNFSSLFINSVPIIVDSNGNLIATSQSF